MKNYMIAGLLILPSLSNLAFADSIIGGPQRPCEETLGGKLVKRLVACDLENGQKVTFFSKRKGGCRASLEYLRLDGEEQIRPEQLGVKKAVVKISKTALIPSSIEVYIQDNENGPTQLQASVQGHQNKTMAGKVRAVGAFTKGWEYAANQTTPEPHPVSLVTHCSVSTTTEPIPAES